MADIEQQNAITGISSFQKWFNRKRPYFVMETCNPVKPNCFIHYIINCYGHHCMDPHGWLRTAEKEKLIISRENNTLQFADEGEYRNFMQDINLQKLRALVQKVWNIIKSRMRYSSFIKKCLGGLNWDDGSWSIIWSPNDRDKSWGENIFASNDPRKKFYMRKKCYCCIFRWKERSR